MAYERSESAWDNFGKFIHQFTPETKTLIRKVKRILIKLYRQNVSLLFNQTCLNERLLPKFTYFRYIYVYIRGSLNKFPDFFRMSTFIDETLVPFEVISSSCNALVVPFQQLLEGPMGNSLV